MKESALSSARFTLVTFISKMDNPTPPPPIRPIVCYPFGNFPFFPRHFFGGFPASSASHSNALPLSQAMAFNPAWNPWMMGYFPFSFEDIHQMLYGGSRTVSATSSSGNSSKDKETVSFPGGNAFRRSLLPEHKAHETDFNPADLPSGLCVKRRQLGALAKPAIFTKTLVTKGARYGPYRGRIVQPSEVKSNGDHSMMWEVFDDGKLSHFMDGRTQNGVASWMSLVQCAKNSSEQNLEVIQQDGEIYYQALRDIEPDSELLVWYGQSYEKYLGIPTKLLTTTSVAAQSPKQESEETKTEGFSCERCGKMFTYKYYLEKHLKFTRCVDMGNRGFPCPICDRSFEKRDRLRIHILHVHEKYKPHVCGACGKSFSQSSSLNKHIRVHTGQRPYKCVHCAKTFTASSILRTHIRQHSGEKPFKCRHCGKSFASHAAHDSHVKRTHGSSKADYQVEDEQVGEETGVLLVDV